MDSSAWNATHGEASDPSGPVDIPLLRLMLCILPLALVIILSNRLHLGLHSKLAIAVVRCATQLSIVGYILGPILTANKPWITFPYTLFMLCMAAAEAVSRPTHSYNGMMFTVLLCLGLACTITIFFGLSAVVNISPWYEAAYLIPMLGMLMGNGLSSVAVGLTAVLDELSTARDKIEALLALGASRFEATREVIQKAARLAFTPLLNNMSVVGIVSIPGMMSGQILGGSNPIVAARYQIVIFYLVALASSCAATAVIYASVLAIVDGQHRLRPERLHAQVSQTKGALAWLACQASAGLQTVRKAYLRLKASVFRLQANTRTRQRHSYFEYRRGSSSQGDPELATPQSPVQPLLDKSPRMSEEESP